MENDINNNTYATYNIEQACNTIQKITISNIKDENGCVGGKAYDLNNFDDKYLLYTRNTLHIYLTEGVLQPC